MQPINYLWTADLPLSFPVGADKAGDRDGYRGYSSLRQTRTRTGNTICISEHTSLLPNLLERHSCSRFRVHRKPTGLLVDLVSQRESVVKPSLAQSALVVQQGERAIC